MEGEHGLSQGMISEAKELARFLRILCHTAFEKAESCKGGVMLKFLADQDRLAQRSVHRS